jgi:hypothetical protein
MFLSAGRLSGYEVESEVHTDKGRIDAVVKYDKDKVQQYQANKNNVTRSDGADKRNIMRNTQVKISLY